MLSDTFGVEGCIVSCDNVSDILVLVFFGLKLSLTSVWLILVKYFYASLLSDTHYTLLTTCSIIIKIFRYTNKTTTFVRLNTFVKITIILKSDKTQEKIKPKFNVRLSIWHFGEQKRHLRQWISEVPFPYCFLFFMFSQKSSKLWWDAFLTV